MALTLPPISRQPKRVRFIRAHEKPGAIARRLISRSVGSTKVSAIGPTLPDIMPNQPLSSTVASLKHAATPNNHAN